MKTKLTPFAKILIVAGILGAIALIADQLELWDHFKKKAGSTESEVETEVEDADTDGEKVIKIGVVTWGGYAGGQFFNESFKPNKKSRFYKDYGFMVEFKLLDDFNASREAWKNGDIDLMWATIDAFTTEVNGLATHEPRVIYQADWSRGGDAVVVRRGINSVSELKGKKVAFAEMTPSHTFLLWLLDAGGLKYSDIEAVKVANAMDAAKAFKSGTVDAAVVWSPDDADCVASVAGSKVLQSTKGASNIIADVFVAKKSYIDKNRKDLENLLRGWFTGAAEINGSDDARRKASKILTEGMGLDETFFYDAIGNVRLCTYGDNLNFYGLNTDFKGITGEQIYNQMEKKYTTAGYITSPIANWRLIGDPSLLKAIGDMKDKPGQAAEGVTEFTEVTEEVVKKEAISTKQVSINFPSGSSTLDENMKTIIDLQFLDIAKSFAGARIRIEGNTDNKGSRASNVDISKKRAQAVADYLINEHKFDRNRFIIVGNGPDMPVADNGTDAGRAQNRRTDFKLVEN